MTRFTVQRTRTGRHEHTGRPRQPRGGCDYPHLTCPSLGPNTQRRASTGNVGWVDGWVGEQMMDGWLVHGWEERRGEVDRRTGRSLCDISEKHELPLPLGPAEAHSARAQPRELSSRMHLTRQTERRGKKHTQAQKEREREEREMEQRQQREAELENVMEDRQTDSRQGKYQLCVCEAGTKWGRRERSAVT